MRETLASKLARSPRRSVLLACQVVRERDFKLLGRQLLDLSEDGMRVRAEGGGLSSRLNVLTGDAVIVSFLAPFSRRWIDAEASVARVIHGRRPGDRGRGFGLVFEHMEVPTRLRLHREIGWFAPATSRDRGEPAMKVGA